MRTGVIVNLLLALLAGASAQDVVASFNFPNGTTVEESAGIFEGCIDLNQTPSGIVTITLVVTGVNILEGVNFEAVTPSLLTYSPDGPTQQCFSIVILKDNIVQPQSKLIIITLLPTPNVVFTSASEAITIIESDVLQVTWASESYQAEEGSPVTVCVDVVSGTLADNAQLSATVTPTSTGSALAGVDFVVSATDIMIGTDDTQVCTPLTILDNNAIEATESFTAVLTARSVDLEILSNTTTIFITNNNVATIGFTQTEIMVNEGNSSMELPLEVCVQLTLEPGQELDRLVTGMVQTESVTASAGQDFLPISQNFSFTPENINGDTYCFTVIIIGDDTIEQNETFIITLSSSTDDNVAANEVIVTLIHDGDVNFCPALPNILNGNLTLSGFSEGDFATYSCEATYELQNGATVRECLSSNNVGVWSGNEPYCVPVCPEFNVMGGMVTLNGDTATTECTFGYQLSTGERVRVCSDQEWSGEQPTCTIADCGPLVIANGNVTLSSGTLFESIANYICKSGFTLSNGNSRTCGANGMWTGQMPTCNGALRGVASTGVLTVLLVALLATLVTCRL